jgi:outer membrane biosynthesis protein TonB
MKLTTGILVLTITASAWAQSPNVIENTRNTMNAVQQKKTADSNAALAAAGVQGKPAASTQPAAKSAAAPTGKPTAASKPAASKPATGTSATPVAPTVTSAPSKPTVTTAKKPAAKPVVKAKPVAIIVPKTTKSKKSAKSEPKSEVAADNKKSSDAKTEEPEKDKKYSSAGKRDPFLSPVVTHTGGSGCSTGKKCLDVQEIALRGVVRSDNGMIAVVTNSLNKAYFLRENDPVFNGYVVKITGDSITFKETFQDRLGKSSTRDVVKKINTPAV